MKESIKKTETKKGSEKSWKLLHIKELEKRTENLTGAAKEEQKMRILENEKGVVIPREERLKVYFDYLDEVLEKEPEENKFPKFLEMLERNGVFTREELENIAKEEQSPVKEKEGEFPDTIKNETKNGPWLKKMLLISTLMGTQIHELNKEQVNIPENGKNKTEIPNEKSGLGIHKTYPPEETKRIGKMLEQTEKLPTYLEKPVEFLRNLEFIKDNFYVLDKTDIKNPTLYEISKEGKIISKEVVGIGRKRGDEAKGYTTPAGIYNFTKWLKQEDKNLYGEDGVLRLMGYAIDGEIVDDIGVHRIYPREEVDRTKKMKDPNAEKSISYRCINVFPDYFKKKIMPNYDRQGGKDNLFSTMFIAIMQEKGGYDEEKWKIIAKKMAEDAKGLEEAGKEKK